MGRLEDDAVFTLDFLNKDNKAAGYNKLDLDSKGKFTFGNTKGDVDFGINKWHTIEIAVELGQVKVDGKVIASEPRLGSQTCDESSFPTDSTGKQAMGLTAGP